MKNLHSEPLIQGSFPIQLIINPITGYFTNNWVVAMGGCWGWVVGGLRWKYEVLNDGQSTY